MIDAALLPPLVFPLNITSSTLAAAIEQLPELMRLIVTLSIIEELNAGEIAAVLDLDVADVLQAHGDAYVQLGAALRC